MNPLKKILFALAVAVSLGLVGAGSAYAQGPGVAFQTTSSGRPVRGEGLTETLGEVVFTATNIGTIDGAPVASTIDLLYAVAITNIPAPANLTCFFGGVAGCPAGIGLALVTGTNNQVRLAFTADIAFAVGDSITVSGLRGNAFASGAAPITAALTATSASPTTNPITFTDPLRVVGNVIAPSLPGRGPVAVFSVAATPAIIAPFAVLTCAPPATSAVGANFAVSVIEAFPAVLTTAANEVGFTPVTLPTPLFPVQIDVILTGVPTGFTVTPIAFTGPAATTTTLAIPAAQTQGGSSGAAMQFSWLVTASNLAAAERLTLSFNIGSTATGAPVAAGGLTGAVTAVIRIGPVAALPGPAVRFADNVQFTGTVITISDCVTRLLMSWALANVAGFDTGIAFANTTEDDAAFGAGVAAGAVPQSGTCILTGYPSGGGSPISATTANIPAGQTAAVTLSNLPGFNPFSGYILAVCNFLNAHAFVFLIDGFGTQGAGVKVSQGYEAGIVALGTRVFAFFGEGLGK